ncbi:MAG: type IV secretory system conjugative DNA transfer family protein, partial [Candidatus Saccharibacteria bacterium]|nr:type IV secretory system conjugative DNA transfer family protein [Candidatus Saccharibacteria bacterium]
GQPKSSFNIRKIMDEGKILVVNLSKGLIGEDNAGILGAFLVTKVQLAAMGRSDIEDVRDRRPFFLYVDEFQNFATESFATILSEARKYGLNLTVANQYISQMTPEVRDAVFGNVGTTISFRVSADDAPMLAKQFEPTFTDADILQLNNRNFIISMIINGEKVPAFSATTLSLPTTPDDNFNAIIEHSRAVFSRPRTEVEAEIRENIEQAEKYKKELSDSGREQGTTSNKPQFAIQDPSGNFRPVSRQNNDPAARLRQDFKKSKISPDAAENKTNRPTLKDLGALVNSGQLSPVKTPQIQSRQPQAVTQPQTPQQSQTTVRPQTPPQSQPHNTLSSSKPRQRNRNYSRYRRRQGNKTGN